jgi:dTDP-4-dehydrorhamnose reductase
MTAPRILVLGRSGLAARALARNDPQLLCLGRDDDLDLRRPETIAAALDRHRPAVVINAAAQANVDEAERNPDDAFVLNHFSAMAAATACAERDIGVIHLSTDYVFGARSEAPYAETATAAPINMYGRSKAAGEYAVLQSGPRAAIVRTAWLFAAGGGGFLNTILSKGLTTDHVRIAVDDLARALLQFAARLADKDPSIAGILHFAGRGQATRAKLVEYAFALARERGARLARIERVPASSFAEVAPRPKDTRLSVALTQAQTGVSPRPWQEGVAKLIAQRFP